MKFFKYLVFLILSLFSVHSYSAQQCTYTVESYGGHPRTSVNSLSAACDAAKQRYSKGYHGSCYVPKGSSQLWMGNLIIGGVSCVEVPDPPKECWHPDYKIVTQPATAQIKKSICIPNNGVMCKYTSDYIDTAPIINGRISTIFSSVSKAPAVNCAEELLNPPCDPKDPYGGCFTPTDDGCTRQFDGSILCPDEKEPPIKQGCNGADYCKRPPQGCGQGYVSGTFNGERICIKTKPSNGGGSDGGGSDGGGSDGGGSDGGGSDGGGSDGGGSDGGGSDGGGSDGGGSDGGGSDGGGSDGGGSDGGGSDGGGPQLPVTPDLSGVINAIKNVASKIDHYSKETIESIDTMSKKITGKLDTSNGHLDQIEANTLASKNNSQTTNYLLQQIKDKIGSDSSSENPPSGHGVDLTETNGLLGEIRDGINDIKNVFSNEGKTELEQIGQPSNDSRFTSAEANAQSSLNNLANKLTFGSSSCLSDFQIQLPIFGSINIALSQWCNLLALIKILFQLVVLLTCLRMLDATVRTI